jgi:hypothetical protein
LTVSNDTFKEFLFPYGKGYFFVVLRSTILKTTPFVNFVKLKIIFVKTVKKIKNASKELK